MITCHLFDGPTGDQILDLTPYVRACPVGRGMHGDSDVAVTLALPSLSQQLALLERYGVPWLEVHDTAGAIWAGRVEDPQASSQGELALTAYGPWRALEDARLTELWSDTRVGAWRPVLETEGAGWAPQRYTFDTSDRLFISPTKGAVHGGAVGARQIGGLAYLAPDRGSRVLTNISFDWRFTVPSADWYLQVAWYSAAPSGAPWTQISAATIINGSGPAAGSSHCLSFTGSPVACEVRIAPLFNPGVALAQESGTQFALLTNVRVTSTPLVVDTTLTGTVFSGATSFTVASAAGIVAGMILIVHNTNLSVIGERVQVASVVGTTINLTGPLANTYNIANNPVVRAQQVLTSDIAAAAAATVSALNPTQLQSGTPLIQATTTDRKDVVILDQSPAQVLEQLAADEQLSVGVSRERLLWLRPRDQSAWAQTYAVDAATLTIGRTIEQLRNQVRAVYADASGRPLRTAAATAAQSVARWGLTRQAALATDTTSATEAAALRDYALADTDDPPPQLALSFTQLWTLDGASVPLTELAPGDTLVIRNLPLGTAADSEQLASVRVARTVFDPLADDATARLTVELENPPATLEAALSRMALATSPLPINVLSDTPVTVTLSGPIFSVGRGIIPQ